MIEFYSISDFRRQVIRLLKKKEYSEVEKEIKNEFKGKTIEDIRINRGILVRETGFFKIIKLRLSDKKRNLSKSNGYRLIYLVFKNKEMVIFLFVYPKRGNMGIITVSEQTIKCHLGQFLKEKEKNLLQQYNILSDEN
ncbi:hypothetical protein EZS27_007016 [termite gut metagenome]|jgi:hypothetical protein|uniref:Toxin HigB-2 n=1 Tax=termite gut metagenome TaxID=433724 RepID=A0A5J4SHP6_9ZZZZ